MSAEVETAMHKVLVVLDPPKHPSGFAVSWELADDTAHVMVTRGARMASSGVGVLRRDTLVLDDIETTRLFQRRGLATFVTTALETWGARCGARLGHLVASDQGRLLYRHLGWADDERERQVPASSSSPQR